MLPLQMPTGLAQEAVPSVVPSTENPADSEPANPAPTSPESAAPAPETSAPTAAPPAPTPETPVPQPAAPPASESSAEPAANPTTEEAPATGQDSPTAQDIPRAFVELQGRRLFEVAGAVGISAEQRAADISRRLEDALAFDGVPEVEQRGGADLPTLWLIGPDFERANPASAEDSAGGSAGESVLNPQPNDPSTEGEIRRVERYLMTVTEADAGETGVLPQARAWAEEIETVLQTTYDELNRSPQDQLIIALGLLGITFALQWLLIWLWHLTRDRFEDLIGVPETDEQEHPSQLLNLLLKLVLAIFLLVLWGTALFSVADLFPVTRELSNQIRDRISDTLLNPVIPLGDDRYSLTSFLLLGLGLMAVMITSGVLTEFLRTRFLSALGIGLGIQEAIAVVFKYSFIAISGVVLLQVWGLDLSSLAIFASALSVGIGFGLQDIAKNLGSGLVLVFERPIQVGDFVEVGEYTGTIEKLGARSTRIRTLDDLTVFVPNSRFLEEEVINWSHHRLPSRIKIPVGVAYGSDLEKVKTALLEAAKEQKGLSKAPKPQVFFSGFGDSSLDMVLLVWIPRPQLHVRIKSDLNFKIDAAFRRYGIEIPFPQRDLHLKSGDLPVLLRDRPQLPLNASDNDSNLSK